MTFRLLEAPTGDVVSPEVVMAHLNAPAGDASLVAIYTAGAVGAVDGPDGIGRALLTQRWAKDLDGWLLPIELDVAPIQSIDAVKYVDPAGATQTLDPALYIAHVGERPLVELAPSASLPPLRSQSRSVSIEFTAGYANAAAIPERLIDAILLMTGDLYANRETMQIGSVSSALQLSLTVEQLLVNFRTRFL